MIRDRERENMWIGNAERNDAENELSCKIKAPSVLGPSGVRSNTFGGLPNLDTELLPGCRVQWEGGLWRKRPRSATES